MNNFWVMKFFFYIIFGSPLTGLFFLVISIFLGSFFKFKVQNGNILVGYAKISSIFWSI